MSPVFLSSELLFHPDAGLVEMSISLERQASLANGLLILFSVAVAAIPETRVVGLVCTGLMGISLIFSGVTGHCGWVKILPGIYRCLRIRKA